MTKYVSKSALRQEMDLTHRYIDEKDAIQAIAIASEAEQRALETAALNEKAKDLTKEVNRLGLTTSEAYVVAEYTKGANDYAPVETKGDTSVLTKLYNFYLLDTTDNRGQKTKPVGKLKKNNLLRFTDGTFAPTVGITQEMYNQCMGHDIYTEEGGVYTKVYDAGAYDAEAQWEVDKALIKAGSAAQTLYMSDDGETYEAVTHTLRPWETTETKYTIGLAAGMDIYPVDNQEGDDGKYYKGLFFEAGTWNGIELSEENKIAPTAIGPCPVTTIQENGLIKTRNFFYLYKGMTNCQSNGGLLPNHDFVEDRTYPRVNDMNQVNNMRYARNNNYDVAKPYPFAEGGYPATNAFIIALELLAGTRYLHQANLFGSGISSNDGCNEGNFFTSGGVRLRAQGDADWDYKTFGANSSPLQYNSTGSTSDMSRVLSDYYPKEQCMESQMAASYAAELGINPTVDAANPNYFEFYGSKYYYMNVPGMNGLRDGDMNVRVYKYIQKEVSAYKANAATTFEVEVILRMSLFGGANLSGDIWAYNGGGLEMVGSCTINPSTSRVGNKIDIYVEPDQTKWHSETVISKNGLDQVFGFEALYRHVLETTNLGDSYTLTREGFTPWKTAKASSMAQGECYCQWDNNYWGFLNQRVRIRSLFRSDSNYATCSPRTLYAHYAASNTNRSYSGSAQALIEP